MMKKVYKKMKSLLALLMVCGILIGGFPPTLVYAEEPETPAVTADAETVASEEPSAPVDPEPEEEPTPEPSAEPTESGAESTTVEEEPVVSEPSESSEDPVSSSLEESSEPSQDLEEGTEHQAPVENGTSSSVESELEPTVEEEKTPVRRAAARAASAYTDESWFTFDSRTGTITGYSTDAAAPKDVVIPSQVDGVEAQFQTACLMVALI